MRYRCPSHQAGPKPGARVHRRAASGARPAPAAQAAGRPVRHVGGGSRRHVGRPGDGLDRVQLDGGPLGPGLDLRRGPSAGHCTAPDAPLATPSSLGTVGEHPRDALEAGSDSAASGL
jgi:hypothetical protein